MKVFSALNITTTSLKAGTQGKSYNSILKSKGGATPYTWSFVNGTALPAGLTLNSSAGTITGTPTVAGTFDLTVQLTDSLGGIDQQILALKIK